MKRSVFIISILSFLGIFLLGLVSFNSVDENYVDKSKCIECHGEFYAQENVHAPVAEDCAYCHEATGNAHPGEEKGFSFTDSQPSLCYMCHDALNNMSNVHMPVSDGECTMCHNPHLADNEKLLHSKPASTICIECHDINTTTQTSGHKHFTEGDCQVCHDPHQSNNSFLLVDKREDLCFNCHNEEINVEDKVISNIKQELETRKYIHEALEMDGCATCHSPHSSEYPSLLNSNFPTHDYTEAKSENFELCFNCHDPEMIVKEKTSTATSFRHGDVNMHYLHINGDRGRNCNLCHEMHASDKSFLIAHNSGFGNIKMPMLFTKTNNGGKCQAVCHSYKEYDRTVIPQLIEEFAEVPQRSDSVINLDTTSTIVSINDIEPQITEKEDTTIQNLETGEKVVIIADLEKDVTTEPELVIVEEAKVEFEPSDEFINQPDSVSESKIKEDLVIAYELAEKSINGEKEDIESVEHTGIDSNKTPETKDEHILSSHDTTSQDLMDDTKVDTLLPTNIGESETEALISENVVMDTIIDEEQTKYDYIDAFEELKDFVVYFSFDKYEISPDQYPTVKKFLHFMNEYPKANLKIVGYTDSLGSTEYNAHLSYLRAKSVADMLIKEGINPTRITIIAEGEGKPKNDNDALSGRKENRRVEIHLQ